MQTALYHVRKHSRNIRMAIRRYTSQCSILVLALSIIHTGGARGLPSALAQVLTSEGQEQAFFVSSEGAAETFAAVRPFTDEELISAVPYHWHKPDTIPDGEVVTSNFSEYVIGEPGFVKGGLPEGKHRRGAAVDPDQYAGEVLFTTATGYPGPFTRYENFHSYRTSPYQAVGKLFFRPFGSTGVATCTATSIGNDAIWTAGHCVSDGQGHWHSNWVFIPAYRQIGSTVETPFGQWTGLKAFAFAAWHTSASHSRDSGGVILQPLNGAKISQRVGWLGFAWNQDPVLVHWLAMGYPGNIASGQRQIICTAGLTEIDATKPAPRPVGMGCDMQHGSSGGPWISKFGSSNLLNGNVSYGLPGVKPLEFFSPYFDTQSKGLLDLLLASTP